MFAVPVAVYLYQSSTNPRRYAASLDSTGANIPIRFCEGGYWKLLRAFFLTENDPPRVGIDNQALRKGLASNCWHVWEVELREVPLD